MMTVENGMNMVRGEKEEKKGGEERRRRKEEKKGGEERRRRKEKKSEFVRGPGRKFVQVSDPVT